MYSRRHPKLSGGVPDAFIVDVDCRFPRSTKDSSSIVADQGPSWPLIVLLGATAGLVVMNIYYNQPILNAIARSLGVGSSAVAWVSTATQLGYAAGLLFVLPIGDGVDRKRLIAFTTLLSSGALIVVPFSTSLPVLLLSSFAVGATSVTPQLVVPYAAGLAAGPRRGKVVGFVMSGLLIGILLSRSVSGFIASRLSWHTVFWLAAGVMLLLSGTLWIALPSQPARAATSYGRLLSSLPRLFNSEPIIRHHSTLGALAFGSFGAFWTTLAFYLHSRPEHYGPDVTGLFGLIGVTGALVAPVAGHLAESRTPGQVNGLFLGLVLLAFTIMSLKGAHTLWVLGAAVVLLDAGIQGNQIANQTRIYSLPPALHSRINSIYMVIYFLGGALGSLVGAQAWAIAGWSGVCWTGIIFTVAALGVLFRDRMTDEIPYHAAKSGEKA
jgi:predicted MFS family arabinose efflux permease